MNTVSIITVNFNQSLITEQLLSSISLTNSYSKTEIIVVDNGSKVNDVPYWQTKYPDIKFIRSEINLGFAGGNNLGVREATGEYLFFVNNDTEFTEGLIQTLVDILDTHSEVGMVSPKIRYFDQPNTLQYVGFTAMNYYTCRNYCVGQFEVDKGQYDKFPTYSKHYGIKKKDPKVKDEKERAQQIGHNKVEDNTDGITERFFKDALRLVSYSSYKGGRQFQPEITCPSLNRFFQTEYSKLNFKSTISRDKLNDVINSEGKSMYTAFENNIIAQYKNRLSEVINNIFNYKWEKKNLDKLRYDPQSRIYTFEDNSNYPFVDEQLREQYNKYITSNMSALKSDIMNGTDISTESKYKDVIGYLRTNILPDMSKLKSEDYEKDIQYCVKVDPQFFFVSFCKLHYLLGGTFEILPTKNHLYPHILP